MWVHGRVSVMACKSGEGIQRGWCYMEWAWRGVGNGCAARHERVLHVGGDLTQENL